MHGSPEFCNREPLLRMESDKHDGITKKWFFGSGCRETAERFEPGPGSKSKFNSRWFLWIVNSSSGALVSDSATHRFGWCCWASYAVCAARRAKTFAKHSFRAINSTAHANDLLGGSNSHAQKQHGASDHCGHASRSDHQQRRHIQFFRFSRQRNRKPTIRRSTPPALSSSSILVSCRT